MSAGQVESLARCCRELAQENAHLRREVLKMRRLSVADAEEVRSVSVTGGEKGTKPERFDLIPPAPLRMLARLYGQGAKKYDDRNWERGYDYSLAFAALNRHLWQWWGGEDLDPETGMPHIVHVAWHAFLLTHFGQDERYRTFDDRPGRA